MLYGDKRITRHIALNSETFYFMSSGRTTGANSHGTAVIDADIAITYDIGDRTVEVKRESEARARRRLGGEKERRGCRLLRERSVRNRVVRYACQRQEVTFDVVNGMLHEAVANQTLIGRDLMARHSRARVPRRCCHVSARRQLFARASNMRCSAQTNQVR